MIPPVVHTCCHTPCFQEYEDQENFPCWGNISCVNTELIDDGDGGFDEYRYGACQGHYDMYSDYDKSKYISPPPMNIWIQENDNYHIMYGEKGTVGVFKIADDKWRWTIHKYKKSPLNKRDGWWGICNTKEIAQKTGEKRLGSR